MSEECYAGGILRINLTKKLAKREELDKKMFGSFLGGVGVASKMMWDDLKGKIQPLSPDNRLIFTTGPLTGTLAPGSGSLEICFKSPLTGIWGESRMGGFFGPEMKFAGYDIIEVVGRARDLTYVWIDDGEVKFKDCQELVSKSPQETEEIVKEETDYLAHVLSIGVAGEKLVKFATVMGDFDRAAGRCGAGAVMGSKNLKAIAIKGTRGVGVADLEEFIKAVDDIEAKIAASPGREGYTHGTISAFPSTDYAGDLPTMYGRSNAWGMGDKIFQEFEERFLIRSKSCFACSIGCGRVSKVKSGRYQTGLMKGPEYETIAVFTALMLNEDIEVALKANELCNRYGMDTLSLGNGIAFLMECADKGTIEKNQDGLDLSWGNGESIIGLIHKTASRDGVGDDLALGVRDLSVKLGVEPGEALHVKGLELPMHDPRAGKNFALQYGTGNRGMCHIHPFETVDMEAFQADFGMIPWGLPDPKDVDRYQEEGKAGITKLLQDYGVIMDVIGVCKFFVYTDVYLSDYSRLLTSALGYHISEEELLRIGERVINMQRCFNCREGIRRRDDLIPDKLRKVPEFGPFSEESRAAITNYEGMLDDYYNLRGWDEEGIPLEAKLQDLGIEIDYGEIAPRP